MATKAAAELSVGDVFCRDGRPDVQYRVRAVQAVPIYGFYGNLFDTIEVTVDYQLSGRVTNVNLSPDEQVVLVPPDEVARPAGSDGRLRWSRRRRTS